jgi:hypothetical protein
MPAVIAVVLIAVRPRRAGEADIADRDIKVARANRDMRDAVPLSASSW